MIRFNYADKQDVSNAYSVWPTFTIVPLWDHKGSPTRGVFADGAARRCRSVDGEERCVLLAWPAGWTAYAKQQFAGGPRWFWHGSLLEDKADYAGTRYKRNRYYDPETGRFTQEDPIGLGGGLNLYGFAGGDPVNLSDPFGLCPEEKTGRPCSFFDLFILRATIGGQIGLEVTTVAGTGSFGYARVGPVVGVSVPLGNLDRSSIVQSQGPFVIEAGGQFPGNTQFGLECRAEECDVSAQAPLVDGSPTSTTTEQGSRAGSSPKIGITAGVEVQLRLNEDAAREFWERFKENLGDLTGS